MTSFEPVRVQSLSAPDLPEILHLDQAAFIVPADPDEDHSFFDWNRTFGVRQGQELVGFNTVFALQLAVPGGMPPAQCTGLGMAGLSWVAVHPGYRRRGIFSAMMRHHLEFLHQTGAEPLSGLIPSETPIYGRMGYGTATSGLQLTVPRGAQLRPLPQPDERLTVSFVPADPDTHAELVAQIHAKAWAKNLGMVSRPLALTRLELFDTPRTLQQNEPKRLLIAYREGTPTGYVLLRRHCTWVDAQSEASTEVLEFTALDAPTAHLLWQTVLDFDLTAHTVIRRLDQDDPLRYWLVDARTPKPTLVDKLWLRIVDLDRCLTGRGYATEVDVVLDVTDELCPWNVGRWRLITDGSGATCERTSAPADLALDIRELGAVLPGGTSLAALGAAGLVQEQTPGALQTLSIALRGHTAPSASYLF